MASLGKDDNGYSVYDEIWVQIVFPLRVKIINIDKLIGTCRETLKGTFSTENYK